MAKISLFRLKSMISVQIWQDRTPYCGSPRAVSQASPGQREIDEAMSFAELTEPIRFCMKRVQLKKHSVIAPP